MLKDLLLEDDGHFWNFRISCDALKKFGLLFYFIIPGDSVWIERILDESYQKNQVANLYFYLKKLKNEVHGNNTRFSL